MSEQRFGVYWNLHKGGFSICLMKSAKTRGTVVAHASEIAIEDVTMVVNEGGRQRSIAKAKEVHAFMSGRLVGFRGTLTDAGREMGLTPSDPAPIDGAPLRYNPHVCGSFFLNDAEQTPVTHAARVYGREEGGKARLTVQL